MQRVAGGIAVCENEWLRALTGSPSVREQGSVPVDFVEEMRGVDPTNWAVGHASLGGTCTTRELHVILVVVNASCWVITGWKVNISTKRRGIAITVLVGKSDT